MFKKTVSALVCFVSLTIAGVQPGIEIMGGARYDNLRMCVASPAGTKGGPMADAALILTFPGEKITTGVKIPLFRPILFGLAFKMVQFEPEMYLRLPLGTDSSWTLMPGAGVSVHYGPDYNSDRKNYSESFWAAGPTASVTAVRKIGSGKNEWGLRPFVTGLFGDNDRSGIVAGCSFEYLIHF